MIYQSENSVGQRRFECILYQNFSYILHMHRHWELIYVAEGSIIIECNGQKETLSSGSWAMIPSNILHAYQTPQTSSVYVCVFSDDHISSVAKELRGMRPLRASFSCRPSVTEFARSELLNTNGPYDFYTVKAALYAVTGEFLRQTECVKITARSELLVNRLIHYVAENFREDITLRSVALALGYEEHYLSRCFHTLIPMHFSRYVNLYRVDAATELMQHTDLTVTEIALMSGFQSIRSFNRVYREITGRTPKTAFEKRYA